MTLSVGPFVCSVRLSVSFIIAHTSPLPDTKLPFRFLLLDFTSMPSFPKPRQAPSTSPHLCTLSSLHTSLSLLKISQYV